MSQEAKEIFEFGAFRLDVKEHRLERSDGQRISPIPEKAFQTLVHLVRNGGSLVSKKELLAVTWPDTIVEENNLDKAIHTIRHVLGEKHGEQKFVETIRKHGFRFVAEVRTVAREKSSNGDGTYSLRSPTYHPSGNSRTAFEAYQLARVSYYQMAAFEARELIAETLRLDPGFAPAYSLTAELITLEVVMGLKTPAEGFAEARSAIAKAYELGADTVDYYAAAGYVEMVAHRDFDAAERYQRKALAINPHHSSANRMLGENFMFRGRHEEAAIYLRRAHTDELTAMVNGGCLAISRYLARDFVGTLDLCDQMLALYPRFVIPVWTRCWALEQLGRLNEAIAAYDKILRVPQGAPALRWIGYAYAIAGERKKALETIAQLEAIGQQVSISPTHIAATYAALDEHEKAISFIKKSFESEDPWIMWIGGDPRFDSLRGHQDFDEIIGSVFSEGSPPATT